PPVQRPAHPLISARAPAARTLPAPWARSLGRPAPPRRRFGSTPRSHRSAPPNVPVHGHGRHGPPRSPPLDRIQLRAPADQGRGRLRVVVENGATHVNS